MPDSAVQPTRPPLSLLWRARRQLGAWVTVVGHTPEGEPVLLAGADRLVLRRTDEKFWPARRCPRCGAEVASPDLDWHGRHCPPTPTGTTGPGAPSVSAAPPDRGVPPSAPAVARPDVRAVAEPAPKRQQDRLQRAALTAETIRERATLVAAVLALTACVVAVAVFLRWLTSDSGPTNRRSASAPTSTAPPVSQVTTPAPQASARPADPVVATVNTTLARPTTTPALSETNGLAFAGQLAFQEQSVAEARPRVIERLPKEVGTHLVRSVERLEFDRARPTIRLEVTSPATSSAQLREAAWAATQWMLRFWDPAVVRRVPNAVPIFRLTLNRIEVECSANLMMQLGYGGASQEQWAAACGAVFR